MAKKIVSQRRGKGSPTFISPSHRNRGRIHLPTKGKEGVVLDLVHCPGHSAPIAVVKFDDEISYVPAVKGLAAGQKISRGSANLGSITKLGDLPEGTHICCVELKPHDGGKMIRTAGGSGTIISKEGKVTVIRLPSGKVKRMDARCRAIVGKVAGEGKKEKPMIKAGKKFHAVKAKNTYWPRVSANKKNACDHPFGGGNKRHAGKPESVRKSTPPGRKVGLLWPKRTGKKK